MTTLEEKTFEVVAGVIALLDARGTPNAIVGAVALAAHGYVRSTRDVDIGVVLPSLKDFDELGAALRVAFPRSCGRGVTTICRAFRLRRTQAPVQRTLRLGRLATLMATLACA